MDMDPVKSLEARLIADQVASPEEIEEIKDRIKVEIDEAAQFAEESPFPDPSELFTDNYMEPNYPFITD